MPPFSLQLDSKPEDLTLGEPQAPSALDRISAPTAPKPPAVPGATTQDDPGFTEFLNQHGNLLGAPTHPSLGVFMYGRWKGKTPGFAREQLYQMYKRGENPGSGSGPGGGLRSGGLSGGGGLTDEATWRKMFPKPSMNPSSTPTATAGGIERGISTPPEKPDIRPFSTPARKTSNSGLYA
jgi:hypothetical protein